MMVEGGDLEHLGHWQVHLACQRDEVPVVQAPVEIIQFVEILDQQVTTVRTRADEFGDFSHRNMIGLAALQLTFLAEAAAQLFDGRDGDDAGFWSGGFDAHCGSGCVRDVPMHFRAE
jgi:hypothetical protein